MVILLFFYLIYEKKFFCDLVKIYLRVVEIIEIWKNVIGWCINLKDFFVNVFVYEFFLLLIVGGSWYIDIFFFFVDI